MGAAQQATAGSAPSMSTSAKQIPRLSPGKKCLASLAEMRQPDFVTCMDEINRVAREGGLTEYHTYRRLWEYPWSWRTTPGRCT